MDGVSVAAGSPAAWTGVSVAAGAGTQPYPLAGTHTPAYLTVRTCRDSLRS
jgi:hypothetical protein